MGWNRQHSNLEELMFNILTKHKALSLKEIVQFIDEKEDGVFQGKTPTNSLFSIIYRREKRREEENKPLLFSKEIIKGRAIYSINLKNKEYK